MYMHCVQFVRSDSGLHSVPDRQSGISVKSNPVKHEHQPKTVSNFHCSSADIRIV